jgi:alkylation response protein AidB-like acyl-CoA dehydrogenase
MRNLLVDTRDVRFLLYEVFEVDSLTGHEKFSGFSRADFEMVLNTAEKLALNVLEPLNKIGDREGCRFENGEVKVPAPFHEGHRQLVEGGWHCLSDDPEVGGQGLPEIINVACKELFVAANGCLTGYSGLSHGVAKMIEEFGTEEQKEKFMRPIYEGRFCGTMCLTEPQAGSDVGAIRTKAVPREDGNYSLVGSKIFITNGNHDLAENIIHAVLARIEGDPAGTKGLSLFLVPRFLLDKEGNPAEANDVVCTGIEKKMGIHASATCSLSFGDAGNCVGYLLGKPRQGIEIMFRMMNEARLAVGIQANALASSSYLKAAAYARERIQGPHFTQVRRPDAPKVPIIQHPDVRRMLATMKAYVEGGRALMYFAALCMDKKKVAETSEEKDLWQGYLDLLTPVVKGYLSERGFEVCAQAIQVLGGYGYTQEYPLEQNLRDCKITSIYEGTTGIQALDFLGRKLGMKGGKVLGSFLSLVDETVARAGKEPELRPYAQAVGEAKGMLWETVLELLRRSQGPELATVIGAATPFLELFGDVVLAWLHLWQAAIAREKQKGLAEKEGAGTPNELRRLAHESNEAAFYAGKLATAKFYIGTLLPRIYGKIKQVLSPEAEFLIVPEGAFFREF